MEGAIGLRQQVVVRDHLFEPVSLELGFDHRDQGVAGQGVEFDALVDEDVDLGARRAIGGELLAQDARADLGRGGRLSLEALDVGKPKSEIDHLDGV